MRNCPLILAAALLVAACSLPKVPLEVVAVKQPNIDNPAGFEPVAAVDVRFIDRPVGPRAPADPAGCERVGAVYSNVGYSDWLLMVPLWRPIDPQIRWQMREQAGRIGANALALPNGAHAELATLNHAVAYRCP